MQSALRRKARPKPPPPALRNHRTHFIVRPGRRCKRLKAWESAGPQSQAGRQHHDRGATLPLSPCPFTSPRTRARLPRSLPSSSSSVPPLLLQRLQPLRLLLAVPLLLLLRQLVLQTTCNGWAAGVGLGRGGSGSGLEARSRLAKDGVCLALSRVTAGSTTTQPCAGCCCCC